MTERLTLAAIERLAAEYAAANEALSLENSLMAAEINTVIRARMPAIRVRIEAAVTACAALRTAVASAPHLFAKPRTRVLNGIKVGFQRLQGGVRYPEGAEPGIIAKIKALWPERAQDIIRTTEKLLRTALEKLPAADLRKIGVTVVAPSDVVVSTPQVADAVKVTNAILRSWYDQEDRDTLDA